MRITQIEMENVKRIKAISVRFDPKKNMIVIGGQNGQGKTSFIDGIMYALSGKSVSSKPIRNGKDKAVVKLDLGDYQVERRFTPSGSKLIVTANGDRLPSPDALLQSIYSKLTFDPLDFTMRKPKEQLETLQQIAGLDFADLDKSRAAAYEKRTDINREVKRLQGSLDSMPFHANVPKEPIDVADLKAKAEKASAFEGKITELESTIANAEKRRDELNAEIERLHVKVADLNKNIGVVKVELLRVMEEAEAQEIDTDEVWNTIKESETINAKVRENQKRDEVEADLEKAQGMSKAQSALIDDFDDKRAKRIRQAKLPIEGLGFAEDHVTFNGLPFDQCSGAEQLRISTAIALAQNPELRTCLVRGGPLLDEKSLALMSQLADELDFQIIMERVGDGKECSLIIEDGQVIETREGVTVPQES